jgi:hypothetical protein
LPIVIDIPPTDADGSLNANIVNVWQRALDDAGRLGVDKGKGVRLQMLPRVGQLTRSPERVAISQSSY